MKLIKKTAYVVALGVAFASFAQAKSVSLNSQEEKVSYTIGVDMGKNFKNQSITINPDAFIQGLKDGMAGGDTLMTQKDMEATLVEFQKSWMAKREAQVKELASKNAQEGQDFLNANKAKDGVKVTNSGLQYKEVTPGTGDLPKSGQIVTVDYQGQFVNGKVFDSSYERGKPATFPVDEVIPGWTEALKMMKTGSTWEIYVPANLAYGEQGMGLGGPIGPNQTLVFKIHLISVKDKTDAKASQTSTDSSENKASSQMSTDSSQNKANSQASTDKKAS